MNKPHQQNIRIQDQEQAHYHQHITGNPYNEEYGIEGMELTPSQSSAGRLPNQASENSFGQQIKIQGSSIQHLSQDDEEEIFNQHYNQILSQQNPNAKMPAPNRDSFSSAPHQVHVQPLQDQRTASRVGTPGFQSLNNSLTQQNVVQQQQMVEKLSQKIRMQAERLQFLENYKGLCEKRIRDFEPGHQIPVLPSHIGQMGRGKQEGEYIEALQKRIAELQQEVVFTNELKKRLQQVEESLRSETLVNEEQRAYIDVLRDLLDQKLKQIGFIFRNNQGTSQVDGFFQLMDTKKENEQYKSEIRRLQASIQEIQIKAQEIETQLQSDYQTQESQLKNHHQQELEQAFDTINQVKEENEQLHKEKDTLLNFVEDKTAEQKQIDIQIQEYQQTLQELESALKDMEKENIELKEGKLKQEEFLMQVQNNMKQIREDKERLNDELDKLTLENQEVDKRRREFENQFSDQQGHIERLQQDMIRKDDQIRQQNRELITVKSESGTKITQLERELKIQKDLTSENEKSSKLFRNQLDEECLKSRALQDTNHQLNRTLLKTQEELEHLVSNHERVSNQFRITEKDYANLREQLRQKESELSEKTLNCTQLKQKEERLDKELKNLYATLDQKESVVKDCESRLLKQLREKEQENRNLTVRLDQIEAEKNQTSIKLEYFEKLTQDKTGELQNLKKTLDMKNTAVEDMKEELKKIRDESQFDIQAQERTMSIKMNERDRRELELSMKLNHTQDELQSVKEQKELAEKLLKDKLEEISKQEEALKGKEEKLKRWEEDIEKLEGQVKRGHVRGDEQKVENERLRSMRVDDAMLIDQMRNQTYEIKDILNNIVGQVSLFTEFLNKMEQQKFTRDLESLYENCIKIRPIGGGPETSDIIQSIKSFKDIFTSLITLFKKSNSYVQTNSVNLTDSPPSREWAQNTVNQEEIRMYHMTSDNLKQSLEQIQLEKEKHLLLREKIDSLDLQLGLEQQEKNVLEGTLRRFLQFRSLNPKLKTVITDLLNTIRELTYSRTEKYSMSSKLQQKEQRFHTLSKTNGGGSLNYQREVSNLKISIERERLQVKDLDYKIELQTKQIENLNEEMFTVDSMIETQNDQEGVVNFQTNKEIEDLKRENKKLIQEREQFLFSQMVQVGRKEIDGIGGYSGEIQHRKRKRKEPFQQQVRSQNKSQAATGFRKQVVLAHNLAQGFIIYLKQKWFNQGTSRSLLIVGKKLALKDQLLEFK